MGSEATRKAVVTYTVDLATLPPLTDRQKAELAALATRPDELIDYSDIPPLGDEFWENAVRSPFCKPHRRNSVG